MKRAVAVVETRFCCARLGVCSSLRAVLWLLAVYRVAIMCRVLLPLLCDVQYVCLAPGARLAFISDLFNFGHNELAANCRVIMWS